MMSKCFYSFWKFSFGYKVTIAYLKDKATSAPPTNSNASATSGVRSAAARLLGGGNGSRALGFVGGNGSNKVLAANSKSGSVGTFGLSNSSTSSNYDGKGTYLIFNVGDTLFISDLNSQDKVKFINLLFLSATQQTLYF